MFTVEGDRASPAKGFRGRLNFNEPINESLTPLQQRMQEGRTEILSKRNEILFEALSCEVASWKKRSAGMESALKETKATYEKRIMMLEAQVASLIEVAGCACKEQIGSKSEPKKREVALEEQARSSAKRVEPYIASERKVQVDKKKESPRAEPSVQMEKKKAAAEEDNTSPKVKVQGEAPWLQVINKKAAKSATREVNKQVKWALAGPKAITPVTAVFLRFHMRRGIESHMHKEKYRWVNTVLRCIKVNDDVKEKSLIGNAILALYVETENVEMVKEKITKWAEGRNIFITQEEINAFAGQGKLTKEEVKQKEINRATVLCARNPNKHIQDCLLANIDAEKHEEIKREATILRGKWQGKEEGENNNDE